MPLSNEAKLVAGITLLTVPTIELGGTFLLPLLGGGHQDLALTEFQRAMFRAGHAHAGVLVILGLVCQIFLDNVRLPPSVVWALRFGFVAGALLISGGFFGAASGAGATAPNGLIGLLWAGVIIEGFALVGLGAGLIRGRSPALA